MSDSSWFSFKRFGVALATVALGTAAGVGVVPLFGRYVGMLAGSFAAGLAFDDRPLLESGVAALLSGLGATLLARIVGIGGIREIIESILNLLATGPQVLLLVGVLSFGVGALGAHFGNDFRDGLTRSVGD